MLPNLVELIKMAALDAVNETKPVNILFGKVISVLPLKIRVEQKLILSEEQLILTSNVMNYKTKISFDNPEIKNIVKNYSIDDVEGTNYKLSFQEKVQNEVTVYNGLKINDEVILLQLQGGQKFLVLDKVVRA